MPMDEFRKTNLANWDERVGIHAASRFYDLDGYVSDPKKISDTVRFDQSDMGDINGKSLLHLQCHIGTDTLSLARLGAEVTGVDFSPEAIDTATRLSADCGTPGRFAVAELYESPQVIKEQFDYVYTGVGALTWLPDIASWGQVVASFLKPGGRLYIRDFHPMLLAIDDEGDSFGLVVKFPYFESGPLPFTSATTYTGDHSPLVNSTNYEWNHGLGEIVMSLIDNGLQIEQFREYRSASSQILSSMVEGEDGFWRLPGGQDKLPMEFSIRAVKA